MHSSFLADKFLPLGNVEGLHYSSFLLGSQWVYKRYKKRNRNCSLLLRIIKVFSRTTKLLFINLCDSVDRKYNFYKRKSLNTMSDGIWAENRCHTVVESV